MPKTLELGVKIRRAVELFTKGEHDLGVISERVGASRLVVRRWLTAAGLGETIQANRAKEVAENRAMREKLGADGVPWL